MGFDPGPKTSNDPKRRRLSPSPWKETPNWSLISLGIGLLMWTSCAPSSPPLSSQPRPSDISQFSIHLKLPPAAETPAALHRLERLGRQGSCPAAWLSAQYLLDLFDLTRLTGGLPSDSGASSHKLLWQRLGLSGPPGRGRLATQQVLQGLVQRFRDIAPRCPEKENARLALDMLRVDSTPRKTIERALAAAVRYKKIARSGSPLRPNALLRLADWCDKSFHLAAGGDPSQQHRRLNQCLFPLFDADPSPYFEEDPQRRPTDPPWSVLAEELKLRYQALVQTRFAKLAEDLAQ